MNLRENLYFSVSERLRVIRSRAGYALGLRPRVNRDRPAGITYPEPYRAAIVFTADLELAWAWRFAKCGATDPLAYALRRADQTRRNFPDLLGLFDESDVPITWAVVGHLFLEQCDRVDGRAHPDLPRPPCFENEYWRYSSGDWFDGDPGSNYLDAPAWYAPDLIRAILGTKVKHEIACHTFSHLDLSDNICPPGVADADLLLCQEIAREWGLELYSLVFPANMVGNLDVLRRHGFHTYRLWTGYQLDWPRRDEHGLWQIPEGRCLEKPSQYWTDAQWLGTLYKHVDRAIETGTVCSFWFHPSCHPANVERILPGLLEYVNARRSEVWVTTMDGFVEQFKKMDN